VATKDTPTKEARTPAPAATRAPAPGQGPAQTEAPGGLVSAWKSYVGGLLGKGKGKGGKDAPAPAPEVQSQGAQKSGVAPQGVAPAEATVPVPDAPTPVVSAWTPEDEQALATGKATFGVIGAHQAGRVKPAAEKLPPAELALWRKTVDGLAGTLNRVFVYKALAANHSVAECVAFAACVADKDDKWLMTNCTGGDSMMEGSGTRQAYSHTCGVTTVQTLRAEYDPVYALKLHTENPQLNSVDNADPTKINPKAAAEQKSMHETQYQGDHGAHTGVSASRKDIAKGSGRWVDDWLNSLTATTGLKYKTKKDPSTAEAITTLTDKVGGGMMTPVVIGNGKGSYTHYNLVMHTRTQDEPAPTPAEQPPAPPKARPMVRQGSQGDAVRELQTLLNERGEALAVDGIFGPLTRGAVVRFQTAQALSPDGIVGPLTWGKLDEKKAAPPAPPKTVRSFQFHDPWDGVTKWVSESKINKGLIDIAGSNEITALEVPSAA
jgi:hypothetical protein